MGAIIKKKIGLLGGTFNPIHHGHINLALEIKEKKDLSEVWLVPSLLSPFRIHETLVSPQHRMNMLQAAIKELPAFKICDVELKRSAPSYTVDTVKQLLTSFPDTHFFLLFGEDSLMRFREWKEPLEIVKNISLLIGLRPQSELLKLLPTLGFSEEIASALRRGVLCTRQMEISATDIRERLRKRLYCGHLLPGKVLDYIYENQLYSTAQLT